MAPSSPALHSYGADSAREPSRRLSLGEGLAGWEPAQSAGKHWVAAPLPNPPLRHRRAGGIPRRFSSVTVSKAATGCVSRPRRGPRGRCWRRSARPLSHAREVSRRHRLPAPPGKQSGQTGRAGYRQVVWSPPQFTSMDCSSSAAPCDLFPEVWGRRLACPAGKSSNDLRSAQPWAAEQHLRRFKLTTPLVVVNAVPVRIPADQPRQAVDLAAGSLRSQAAPLS